MNGILCLPGLLAEPAARTACVSSNPKLSSTKGPILRGSRMAIRKQITYHFVNRSAACAPRTISRGMSFQYCTLQWESRHVIAELASRMRQNVAIASKLAHWLYVSDAHVHVVVLCSYSNCIDIPRISVVVRLFRNRHSTQIRSMPKFSTKWTCSVIP